jgi:hypothetical protein
MDLHSILFELHAERKRLGRIIEALEQMVSRAQEAKPKRRGRKRMDAASRQAVSQRMKRYWAGKKTLKKPENLPPQATDQPEQAEIRPVE